MDWHNASVEEYVRTWLWNQFTLSKQCEKNSADNWTNTAKMLEETRHYTHKIKTHNRYNRCELEGRGKNTTSGVNWNGDTEIANTDCKYWNCELYLLPSVGGRRVLEIWCAKKSNAHENIECTHKKIENVNNTLSRVRLLKSVGTVYHKSAATLLDTNGWNVISNEIVWCRISSNITGSRREICKPPGKHSRGCWSRQTTRLSCPATNYTWL